MIRSFNEVASFYSRPVMGLPLLLVCIRSYAKKKDAGIVYGDLYEDHGRYL